jgi:hypothetical protein
LVLAGVTLERIEALATRRPYVIVGRNALASFTLRLDGPKQELEIRSPSPSRVKRRRSSRR